MRKFYLLLALSGWLPAATAQEPGPVPSGRFSPATVKNSTDNQPTIWWIFCKDTSLLRKQLIKIGPNPITRHDPRTGLTVLNASWRELLPLVRNGLIRYADQPRIPKEELTIITFDASANQLNTIHHLQPSLDGRNLVLSLKERRPDTADIDFRGRFLSTSLADAGTSTHATIMGTMAAGAGNSHITGKGAASGATISSASFINLLPEKEEDYQRYNISVQNHSYGTAIENYYGADALAYDASLIANPALVHVFSAGNEGLATAESGAYANIPGFANLTGSFKMAKNIITVGAIDSFYNIAPLSSRGPAYDGRLKPELMAYGQDGSSGSAAIVSGIALLLQQCFRLNRGNNDLPPASLVKAILINSADDLWNEGPDYASGYGNANAANAVLTMHNNRFFTGAVQNSETIIYDLNIGPGISRFKATLCWTDPPADPGDNKALLHDLDLQLKHTGSGAVVYPWVLSQAAHADSLSKPAHRSIDTINNTEQVSLNFPEPGQYQLIIKGSRVSGSQDFSIAWQADTADRFHWYAPAGSDPLRGGAAYVVRWASTFAESNGILEYSTDGDNWQMIAHVDLAKRCYRWAVPDINSLVRLRITVGSKIIQSDEFIVSSRITGFTGFNCTDSFLVGWNKSPGVPQYSLFTLGNDDQYLRSVISTTAGTHAVFKKDRQPSLLYAIAPVIGGKTGQKSFTFDYTTQGVGCYIKNFLAFLQETDRASITAELGSLYQVKQLVLEKLGSGSARSLQTIDFPSVNSYQWEDDQLLQGENNYRLRIELATGQFIYSEPEKILVVKDGNYLVWPNPVATNSGVWVHAKDFSEAVIGLYNAHGQLLKQQALVNFPQWLPVAGLKSGLYYVIIRKEGKTVGRSSVLVK
ncbi:S8 family peptidase [Pseudobacter ginsenosidimutans]|uniref:Putative secreted protein (Por secretion system target) n=2 Tax=Pseudobacter ginsenosidimutans TaxID=661488 RepID=A0A4Q7MGB2_9BACT|nr:S8 family peptidase [Pseudobacter ginsenosidimutans]RZS67194.1 putative secreted protein (Por secretion system target) [Pseudobacter ginsenosidimutans]